MPIIRYKVLVEGFKICLLQLPPGATVSDMLNALEPSLLFPAYQRPSEVAFFEEPVTYMRDTYTASSLSGLTSLGEHLTLEPAKELDRSEVDYLVRLPKSRYLAQVEGQQPYIANLPAFSTVATLLVALQDKFGIKLLPGANVYYLDQLTPCDPEGAVEVPRGTPRLAVDVELHKPHPLNFLTYFVQLPPKSSKAVGFRNDMFDAFATKDPPPSSAAKPEHFGIVQSSAYPIYNSRYADGHVIDTDAASIELYSPVFSSFMDQFKHHRPSSEELSAASDYIQCSNALYVNEATRRDAIHVAMNKFFDKDDPPASSQLADYTAPDRIQYFRVTGREQMLAPIMVEEDKNEPGLGACDGSIQAAFSARRAWSQNACKIYREASCCPTLLLSTDGPNIAVYGSIFTEFHVVQLLATASTVGCPDPDLREETVARLFVALGAAIRGLKSYYAGLKPASEQLPMSICPWPTDIASRTDPSRSYTLRYIRPLYRGKNSDPKCVVFLAELDEDRQCVVKFSRRYSSRAHDVLATARLAPKLLAIQTLEKTNIQMIVMDYVDGATLWQTRQNMDVIPPQIFEDLNEALRLLHKEKIVFGDLRDTNIILLKNPGEYCVNVVDFDWAAEHGQGRYPQLNTQQIKWAGGMAWRAPMFTHHDHEMLRLMHADYSNNSLPVMVCECASSASA